MEDNRRIDVSKGTQTVSARIDVNVYEFFKEKEISMTNIINILLKGFVTSEDRLGLLMECLESDVIQEMDNDEKKLDLFAKERLGTSLWSEDFIKLYRDLKKLP